MRFYFKISEVLAEPIDYNKGQVRVMFYEIIDLETNEIVFSSLIERDAIAKQEYLEGKHVIERTKELDKIVN